MAKKFQSSPAVRKPDATLVAEQLKSFADFDRWMDNQLESLVARWLHTAAPNANRVRRIADRFGRG